MLLTLFVGVYVVGCHLLNIHSCWSASILAFMTVVYWNEIEKTYVTWIRKKLSNKDFCDMCAIFDLIFRKIRNCILWDRKYIFLHNNAKCNNCIICNYGSVLVSKNSV